MRNQINFKKSSFSGEHYNCVGVAERNEKILVTNTKNQETVVEFTKSEWNAFLKGVKASEFDEFIK